MQQLRRRAPGQTVRKYKPCHCWESTTSEQRHLLDHTLPVHRDGRQRRRRRAGPRPGPAPLARQLPPSAPGCAWRPRPGARPGPRRAAAGGQRRGRRRQCTQVGDRGAARGRGGRAQRGRGRGRGRGSGDRSGASHVPPPPPHVLYSMLIIGSNHLISQTGWNRCNISLSLSLFVSVSCKTRWAGLFSSCCTLANTMCVRVHACFHIFLHVFGVSGILFTPLEHMLAYQSLSVSYLLILARLRRESLLP